MNTSLKTLLNNFIPTSELPDVSIQALSNDSRNIHPGTLFFAYPGVKTDGRDYLKQAAEKGAVVILCEQEGLEVYQESVRALEGKLVIIPVLDLQSKISEIAARFYDHPSRAMTVIGVTGTNGKTSCTHFIAQVLNEAGTPCAVMGTLGNGIPGQLKTSSLTTQDAISIQKILAEFRAQNVKVVAMEVSSHGLIQHRVDGVEFSVAVFTQLSRDHLDYHRSLEEYAAAKEKLFHFSSLKAVVLNLDDEMGFRLVDKLDRKKVQIFAYSQQGKKSSDSPLITANRIQLLSRGFQLHIETPWGSDTFESPLLGRFNISNVLAVLTVLGILNLSLNQILAALSKLKSVAGRLQSFGGNGLPEVIVDYAHTPDALEKVLSTLREHCLGQLWCVFGCGGDRDRGKRPLMAAIAEKYSDQIVLTDDNPRTESSAIILAEIQKGFVKKAHYQVIPDRASAIKYAIQKAAPNDMILVAGKGHEDYQLVGKERLDFSDSKQVTAELHKKEAL